jgi:hypothetical protein
MQMPTQYEPRVGDWYEGVSGEAFEVITVDDDDQTIEIQYTDGTIEELDFDTWQEMELAAVDAPGDWAGPLDMDREEFGSGPEASPPDDWSYSLGDFDPED